MLTSFSLAFFPLTAEATSMIPRANEATRELGKRIDAEPGGHGGDQEAVVRRIYQEDHVEEKLVSQEERPLLINLTALVKAVAGRRK